MSFTRLFGRHEHAGRVSVIVYARSFSGVKRARKVIDAIRSELDVADAFVAYYGADYLKAALPVPVIYSERPLHRGYTLASTAKLASSPILVLVDAETKCLKAREVAEAVDSILSGESLVHMIAPNGSEKLFETYASFADKISGSLPLMRTAKSPSYSIIVTLSRYVRGYSFWFIEPHILLTASTRGYEKAAAFRNECVDRVDLGSLEDLVVSDFKNLFTGYLASRL